ncbi:GIY-YIG nuclease family protein [Mesorhizobium sp.]|uniref:GIY-YIG nuclease family protein n=1 Tax=Mesorhizobium sp. TaxID=1871066 RepID=UPI003416403E
MCILESEVAEGGRYVGMTSDLKRRLAEHNSGKSSHTSKFLPWRIVTHMAFSNQAKAASFERYPNPVQGTLSPTNAFGDGRRPTEKSHGRPKKDSDNSSLIRRSGGRLP